MSSGSYFTLYRKCKNISISQDALDALKNEYFLANKNDVFNNSSDEEEMKKDMPLLMHKSFKVDPQAREAVEKSFEYYDANGIRHDKLVEFSFNSSFTCLREKFNLNPYKHSHSSVLVSKDEAKKMLQAIEYVLGEDYSKKFEQVLNNEYVSMFGNGYSPFDNRFSNVKHPIYIDKDSDSCYTVKFNDYGLDQEIAESDSDVVFNLSRVQSCLHAYLDADEDTWDGEELVLEYSAY